MASFGAKYPYFNPVAEEPEGLHSDRAGGKLLHTLGEAVVGKELAGGEVYGEVRLDEAARPRKRHRADQNRQYHIRDQQHDFYSVRL